MTSKIKRVLHCEKKEPRPPTTFKIMHAARQQQKTKKQNAQNRSPTRLREAAAAATAVRAQNRLADNRKQQIEFCLASAKASYARVLLRVASLVACVCDDQSSKCSCETRSKSTTSIINDEHDRRRDSSSTVVNPAYTRVKKRPISDIARAL